MSGSTSPPAAIDLSGVWFSYGRHTVLEDVNLTVKHGEFIAVLGPNGSGKTTLLKLLLGLLRPSEGTVRVLGKSPREARRQVGYVPQYANFDADFPISVRDVVLMGRLRHKRPLRPYSAKDRSLCSEVLERLELQGLAERQVGGLSGGQLQRVLIARALAAEPSLLLMDEPTASLDTLVGHGVWGVLEALAKRITVVVISHDIGAISRHVGGVACLNRRLHYHAGGRITPEVLEEVYGCPVELVAHGHPHRVLEPHAPSLPPSAAAATATGGHAHGHSQSAAPDGSHATTPGRPTPDATRKAD